MDMHLFSSSLYLDSLIPSLMYITIYLLFFSFLRSYACFIFIHVAYIHVAFFCLLICFLYA